jgi:hypothetical protein
MEQISNNPQHKHRVAHLSHSVQQHQQGAVLSQQLAQVLQGALQLLQSQTMMNSNIYLNMSPHECILAGGAQQALAPHNHIQAGSSSQTTEYHECTLQHGCQGYLFRCVHSDQAALPVAVTAQTLPRCQGHSWLGAPEQAPAGAPHELSLLQPAGVSPWHTLAAAVVLRASPSSARETSTSIR